jgi:hypothetical protein
MARLVQALEALDVDSDHADPAEVSLLSEGAIIAAAHVPSVLDAYVLRIQNRHADCPTDCMMGGVQFSMELLLCAQTLERERAAVFERAWRDTDRTREDRLGMLGQWSTWIVLAGVIGEPKPKVMEKGGHVSSLIFMLQEVGKAWPTICAGVYSELLRVEVPDSPEGLS